MVLKSATVRQSPRCLWLLSFSVVIPISNRIEHFVTELSCADSNIICLYASLALYPSRIIFVVEKENGISPFYI